MLVLSHNVFWLQGVPFAGTEPGPPRPAVLAGLAALYRRLRPDLLLLQEVQSAEALRALGRALDMEGRLVPGRLFPQYGVAALAPEPVPVEGWRELGLRPARSLLLCRYRGLELCCVHLPSGRLTGKERAPAARLEELRALLEVRRPRLIAGDFNEEPGGALSRLLEEAGYRDVVAEHLGPGAVTNLGGRRGDHAWVASRGPRVLEVEIVAGEEMRAGGRPLSDHLPVLLRLAEAP